MRITLSFIFALVIVMIFGTTNAKASLSTLNYTYNLKTSDTTGWEVASIYLYGESGYVNPTKNNSGKYNNASTATTWTDIAGKVAWEGLGWTNAKQGTRDTWVDHTNWLAAAYENESKVDNGYFAFKYTLTATDIDAETVAGVLNLMFGADDYLAAVYANGDILYSQEIKQGATVGDDSNKNGNWLKLDSLAFDVELIDGQLELIFVVHNTNAAGSSSINPMGLYLEGTLSSDIELIYGPPIEPGSGPVPTTTPEPATLLLLGLAGAVGVPAYRRYRKNR